jgi:hypothetical protein
LLKLFGAGGLKALTALDLSKNSFGLQIFVPLGVGLMQPGCQLRSLELNASRSSVKCVSPILLVALADTWLKALAHPTCRLSYLGLADWDPSFLARTAEAIGAHPTSLRSLDVSYMRLGRRYLNTLLQHLCTASQLTRINLSYIDNDLDAWRPAAVLLTSDTLVALHLACWNATASSIEPFCQALAALSPRFRLLDLRYLAVDEGREGDAVVELLLKCCGRSAPGFLQPKRILDVEGCDWITPSHGTRLQKRLSWELRGLQT